MSVIYIHLANCPYCGWPVNCSYTDGVLLCPHCHKKIPTIEREGQT